MRRRRWGILLGSAAFHALLVLLFVLDLGRGPSAPYQEPIQVWLERPAPSLKPSKSSPHDGPRSPAAQAAAEVSPVSPIIAPEALASPPPKEAGVPAPSLSGLNGLGGCRLAALDHLPAEARARCQERLAEAMSEGRAPRPNFDPTGRYVRDGTPYLARPPHNGCKPVAGVAKNGPLGETSATLSIGCAWSF